MSKLAVLAVLVCSFASSVHAQTPDIPIVGIPTFDPNYNLLSPGDADGLPIVDRQSRGEGCYVACYSHRPGVYQVGEFGVHGMVRVPGRYPVSSPSNYTPDRICRPKGNETRDISAMRSFKQLCNNAIPSCKGGCWAGGDTGGFYARWSYQPKSTR